MKKTYHNINLTCKTQEDKQPGCNRVLSGGLFRNSNNEFIFEEETKACKTYTRNHHVYDGKFVSLIRKKDNTLQFSFRKMDKDFDPAHFAYDTFFEINKALIELR